MTRPQVVQPGVQRISAGVLLSGPMIIAALRACDITLRALARNERPAEPHLEALHTVLSECLSECPGADSVNRTRSTLLLVVGCCLRVRPPDCSGARPGRSGGWPPGSAGRGSPAAG